MVTTIAKPNGKCFACESEDWWFNGRNWVCGKCHPNPNAPVVIDARGVGSGQIAKIAAAPATSASGKVIVNNNPEEIEALRKRVAAGNEKLVLALLALVEIEDMAVYDVQMKAWYSARDKLNTLYKMLRDLGYSDCLYVENGARTRKCDSWPKGRNCIVCTSDEIYWNEVICAGHSKHISVKYGDDVIEFLKTLGGKI